MRTIKFPITCPGCKTPLEVQGKKPIVGQPCHFKIDCVGCGSQIIGHMIRPLIAKFQNHLKINLSQLRPSQKLIAMLKSGEVKGDVKIRAPIEKMLPGKTSADREKMSQ